MPLSAMIHGKTDSKPALVLVHGLGSAGNIWNSLISGLTDAFSIYAIDLPGHGEATLSKDESHDPRSLGQMILNYMKDVHQVFSMHVAGNSLGGWIALEMAALDSNAVTSVTALSPAGLWHSPPPRRFAPSIDARILAKISQFFIPIAFRLPPLKALGYRKITHLWRELSYESCRDSVLAMARSKGYRPLWLGAKGKKFSSDIDSKVKVAVVFGDSDVMLPENIAQERSVLPSHAEWIRVKNCAHVIMWNFPKLTCEYIKKTAGLK